jgi:16S rRNA (guanine527-N7)-methyltransferase
MSLHGTPLAFRLSAGLAELGLNASANQEEQLLNYLGLISQWNKVYNLTAIRDPGEMLTHHLLDSLAVVPPLREVTGGRPKTVLDVGAGAGLPGVVIAIMCPELSVTCIDTVAKKAAFMTQVGGTLKLNNFKAVHNRVESWPSKGFDIMTSRAFASLSDFVNWTMFHVKPAVEGGSLWMAMKGKVPSDEISDLPQGADIEKIQALRVPGLDAERCLVWLKPSLIP